MVSPSRGETTALQGTTSTEARTGPGWRAGLEWALILGAATLLAAGPHRISADGIHRFAAVRALVQEGTISPEAYSMIGPYSSIPLYLIGERTGNGERWCARFNLFLLLAGAFALYFLVRGPLSGRVTRRFILLLLLGSMFPKHQQEFGGEVFTAMFVAVGTAAALVGSLGYVGWAAAALGVANTPATLAGLLFAVARSIVDDRRFLRLAFVVAAAGMFLVEGWVRRGNPFLSGYENNQGFRTILPYSGGPGFNYPFLFGVLSILFSFGKGLIFFTPGLFVPPGPADERIARLHRVWVWFVVGLIVVYARWWAWYGGWAWGPRFFLFASVPASLSLALAIENARGGSRRWAAALACVVFLSFWVGANGFVFDQNPAEEFLLRERGGDLVELEYLFWYVPEFSALWMPFREPSRLGPREWWSLGYFGAAALYVSAPLSATVFRSRRRRASG